MGAIVLLALTAALNPTLLAATTVMLLLPKPERLMIGYWLGAIVTGVTLGLVIVFALEGASFENSAEKAVNPAIDLTLAGLLMLVVLVLVTGPHERARKRWAERRKDKKPPKWQRVLDKGTLPATFVIGVLLSFPGASYLAALGRLGKLHYSTAVTVLIVVGFCVVQLVLLEIPIVAFRIAPEQTPIAIERAKAWARSHWRTYAVWGLAVIAAALALLGIVGLL